MQEHLYSAGAFSAAAANMLYCDDGHGDYNRSYDRGYDDFDYADYSTDHRDNNFRNYEKKRRKSKQEIIEDLLKRWD